MILGKQKKGLIVMSSIFDFIKDMFCVTPQTGLIGLSSLKTVKKVRSAENVCKNKEPKLSDLMKRSHKKLKV